MTREEAKHWLEIELKTWEDECKSKHPIKEAFSVAIETLEQEPVIDKISAEIEEAALDDANGSKFIFVNRVNQIIDKYRTESEE